MNNIYQDWDAYADASGMGGEAFSSFAVPFLQKETKATRLPLDEEQARILVDIIDSFVEEAHERHRRNLGEGEPERAAGNDLSKELRACVFTRKEMDAAIASGEEEFAGLTPDKIRARLETRNQFFGLFKASFLKRCGDNFAEALKPYLDGEERARAQEIFSIPVDNDECRAVAGTVDDLSESDAHVDLVGVQAQMSWGTRAKEMLAISEEVSSESEEPPKCLIAGFTGKLLTDTEKLLRKLTAVEFLLARLAKGDDDVSVLPFAAVAAARYAYDWVTERKATLQLVGLGGALKELDPSEFNDVEGKEVRE